MAAVLMLLAIVAGLLGIALFSAAQSAMHEITAGLSLLASAVLLSGAAIVDAVKSVEKKLVDPASPKSSADPNMKKCRQCDATIKADATKCRYCQTPQA